MIHDLAFAALIAARMRFRSLREADVAHLDDRLRADIGLPPARPNPLSFALLHR